MTLRGAHATIGEAPRRVSDIGRKLAQNSGPKTTPSAPVLRVHSVSGVPIRWAMDVTYYPDGAQLYNKGPFR
jgi:hypothetical protein